MQGTGSIAVDGQNILACRFSPFIHPAHKTAQKLLWHQGTDDPGYLVIDRDPCFKGPKLPQLVQFHIPKFLDIFPALRPG